MKLLELFSHFRLSQYELCCFLHAFLIINWLYVLHHCPECSFIHARQVILLVSKLVDFIDRDYCCVAPILWENCSASLYLPRGCSHIVWSELLVSSKAFSHSPEVWYTGPFPYQALPGSSYSEGSDQSHTCTQISLQPHRGTYFYLCHWEGANKVLEI